MNKAFVRESDDDDEELDPPDTSAPAPRNYITPEGHARLKRGDGKPGVTSLPTGGWNGGAGRK